MKIKLKVQINVPNENLREFDLEFTKAQILIGKDSHCDIQIPLEDVADVHARIFESEGSWQLVSLQSEYPTKINAESLKEGQTNHLFDGDIISFSHACIVFELSEGSNDDPPEEKTSIVAQKLVRDVFSLKKEGNGPFFIIIEGPNAGSKIAVNIEERDFLIGRIDNADLRIDDPNISRKHAIIKRDWDKILIEDLGSKNGIILNGKKINLPTRLKDADEIFLGSVRLAFVDPTANIMDCFDTLSESVATHLNDHSETNFEATASTKAPTPSFESTIKKHKPLQKISLYQGVGIIEASLSALSLFLIAVLLYTYLRWFF